MARFHEPVLSKEVIKYLNIKKGKKYIDATVGGGGHAEAIFKNGGIVLGIDCDPEAIKASRERLSQACPSRRSNLRLEIGTNASWRLAQGNFARLEEIAKEEGFDLVMGIVFDLGVSSYQLETPKRGFSFNVSAPLDMRMDPNLAVTAADLINVLSKGELNVLFSKLGQEKYSRRITDAIVSARRVEPIRTTKQLADLVEGIYKKRKEKRRHRRWRRHPATKVFLALRVAVNDEINNLKKTLPDALKLLEPKGRLLVISFHSGEDRIVKRFFRNADKSGLLRIITDKPVRPTAKEVEKNPRSRSAKLRVAEKNEP